MIDLKLELCWLVTCTRCKDESASFMGDAASATSEFIDEGWTAQKTNEIGPHTIGTGTGIDVAYGPYVRTRVLCPQCNPTKRGTP